MLCGMQEIDVDEWERSATYRNYGRTAKQVQFFWRVCTIVTPFLPRILHSSPLPELSAVDERE